MNFFFMFSYVTLGGVWWMHGVKYCHQTGLTFIGWKDEHRVKFHLGSNFFTSEISPDVQLLSVVSFFCKLNPCHEKSSLISTIKSSGAAPSKLSLLPPIIVWLFCIIALVSLPGKPSSFPSYYEKCGWSFRLGDLLWCCCLFMPSLLWHHRPVNCSSAIIW